MIKDLKEAIAHCKHRAEENRAQAENYARGEEYEQIKGKECEECAKDHLQLADWLTELQERREIMELIKKHYVLVEKSPRDNPNELIIRKAFGESEATE